MGDQLSLQIAPIKKAVYLPRGINAVQLLFKKHFQSFADQYENKYAVIYGRFRIARITEVVEKFIRCGDYSQGIARIQCTNPDCKYEYFRPFSCKGFYYCPSCSQKRTLLFSEYMKGRLLLSLPHRQFVFTFPKLLRPYFRHNRRLFSDISRLIFVIIKRFYDKAAGRQIKTGMVLAYQSAGEYLKFNPHYHCIVLEGGFDERGRFVHIPLGNLQRMTEYFRRLIIKFFLNKQLINANLATSLINWKHSGFSIDHSIRIPAFSIKAREALSQYIARPPIALKKLIFQQIGDDTLIFYTPDNEFFNAKIKTFTALQFMAEATQHILPNGAQYIRRYGLYASRTTGKWPDKPHVVRLAPPGWKKEHFQASDPVQTYPEESSWSISDKDSRSTWAKLIHGSEGLLHHPKLLVLRRRRENGGLRRNCQRKHPFCTPVYAGETERFCPKKFRSELINQVQPSIGKTAEVLGVAKSTVWLWSKRIPEFKAKLDEESLRAFRDRTRKRLEELEARTLRTLENEPELKRAFKKIVQGRKVPRK